MNNPVGRGCTVPRRGKGSDVRHVVRSWQHYSATAQPVRLPPLLASLASGFTTTACTQACPSRSWLVTISKRACSSPSPEIDGSHAHPVEDQGPRPLASSTCACRSAPWREALVGVQHQHVADQVLTFCKRHGASAVSAAGRSCWGQRNRGRRAGGFPSSWLLICFSPS